ncbi:hypothetical protein GcM3_186045 [Golovinomyces cichoracearum]|uniref:Uncharacterized protein n=1 Tax=Golovinomyces cichoracearum TaxID=62708 RepID=A0A420HJT7_9PEZI|nr:hypothetical protein GcM3_186045 [Golovinomyces cichoracearum]
MDYFYRIKRYFIITFLDSPIVEGDILRRLVEIHMILSGEAKPNDHSTTRSVLKAIPDVDTLDFQAYDPRDLKHIIINFTFSLLITVALLIPQFCVRA